MIDQCNITSGPEGVHALKKNFALLELLATEDSGSEDESQPAAIVKGISKTDDR